MGSWRRPSQRGHSTGVPASVSEDQDRKGKFSIVPTETTENPRDAGCSLDTVVERSPGGDDFLEAAIAYVQRGWPVLPVQPRGKQPLGRLVGHGLKDATLDEDQVERWWRAEPEANVGLVTGIAFDALDVDGPEGMDAINAAVPWYGEPWDGLPTNDTVDGPTVITGGGGHHVYVAVTGSGNRAGLLPHVDWRGRGGYVVAPPSLHVSGRRYEWFPGWGLIRDIAPAPDWLLKLLRGSPVSLEAGRAARPVGTTSYARGALEAEVGRVALAPEGTRNAELNRAAHALGQLVGGGVLDLGTVIAALEEVGQRVGLKYQEVRATIKSGLAAGMRSPRRVTR